MNGYEGNSGVSENKIYSKEIKDWRIKMEGDETFKMAFT